MTNENPLKKVLQTKDDVKYCIKHKDEYLNEPALQDLVFVKILQIADKYNLSDEDTEAIVLNALFMANNMSLQNELNK